MFLLFILLATMPIAFLWLVCNYLVTGNHRSGVLITGSFILGALASGLVVWHLVSSEWTLPFWTTLEAAGDAEKYGHPVEHAAEQIITAVLFVAVLGGAAGAGATGLGTKLLRKSAHA
jgi:hypothetical protein